MISSEEMMTEWEIIRLSNDFAYFMDHGDFESMIALFTPDAVFDRAGHIHHGHDELRQGMRERPKMTTRHLLTNFYFRSVGKDSAEAIVTAMAYHGPLSGDSGPVVYATDNGRVIEFHDTYTKTPEGWRISSRIARPIFTPKVWP
jgi:ketosteroid isomerase-like protein